MSETGSVSRLICQLRDGNATAAHQIWERYKQKMHAVAGAELSDSSRSVSDEDDVVICAFAAFLRRTSQGAYETMQTRDDLWRLLATITRTYAWKQTRFLDRLRRRTSKNQSRDSESILMNMASGSPSPELLASVSDSLHRLLELLDEPELKEVALGRLQGLSNEEIAANQKRTVRTIERRLQLIRSIWTKQLSNLDD